MKQFFYLMRADHVTRGVPKVLHVQVTKKTEKQVLVISSEGSHWRRRFDPDEFDEIYAPTPQEAVEEWRERVGNQLKEYRVEIDRLQACLSQIPTYEVCCKTCGGPIEPVEIDGIHVEDASGRLQWYHLTSDPFYKLEMPEHDPVVK